MVFQNYALWPHMTVLENVTFGLAVRKVGRRERRRRARAVLAAVHMAEYAGRKPTQLSGGQQQRVALARALATSPDYLLLDEPLSNLDAKLRLQMRSEIRSTQRATRITSLYVTHDQDEALTMADRLAVVRDGRIVAIGSPRGLYHHPPTAWVAGFLGATNFLEGEVAARDGPAALVRAAFGDVRAAEAPAALGVGAAVVMSVRPESVRLLAAEGEAPPQNTFPVTVLARTFRGDTEEVRVRLGRQEAAISDRSADLPAVGTGQAARVHIAPEAVRLFRRDETAGGTAERAENAEKGKG
jgi:ABC-type Fe3+/spermidine/putrescine transport system ATPase subunit